MSSSAALMRSTSNIQILVLVMLISATFQILGTDRVLMLPTRQVGHDHVTSCLPLLRCTPEDSTESRGAGAACTESTLPAIFGCTTATAAARRKLQTERVVITSKALLI